ncbi:MAG: methyltransferase domain-containing protein [Methylococcales bacterium]|nr:methyltransferase domain-containing protein [Methylococcales bacterium]
MKRKFLFSFYETPQGKLLQFLEQKYLKRSITVGCKQLILQIGGLGWENNFIDCTLYQKYCIIDGKGNGCEDAVKICGQAYRLPIQSETVDLVILPHLLEFDINRFQTMREVERVLKPEGELIILNFNVLNIWVRLQFLWNIKMSESWRGYFISRFRIEDWLKLLNFEIRSTSEFTIDKIHTTPEQFKLGRYTFFSMAYAVRAVKRQYSLIPLTPVKLKSSRFVSASTGLESLTHRNRIKKHD